jgi:hypothetical protein
MHGAWWAWPVAGMLYIVFRLWYDNWRGPLRADEVDYYVKLIANSPGGESTDMAVLRRFLDEDDGKEFLMSNLVRLESGPLIDPVTGKSTNARDMMQTYTKGFFPTYLRLGGHPVVVARKVGGFIDSWKSGEDPAWTASAFMRYRSRRDCMRMATHPRFLAAYPFKVLATAQTISFPTQVFMSGTLRPRASVLLLLMLAAALVHLASLVL